MGRVSLKTRDILTFQVLTVRRKIQNAPRYIIPRRFAPRSDREPADEAWTIPTYVTVMRRTHSSEDKKNEANIASKRLSGQRSSISRTRPNITRRDFIGATLVGSGAILLGTPAPAFAQGLPASWNGYAGIGDYSRSNGRNIAHAYQQGTSRRNLRIKNWLRAAGGRSLRFDHRWRGLRRHDCRLRISQGASQRSLPGSRQSSCPAARPSRTKCWWMAQPSPDPRAPTMR